MAQVNNQVTTATQTTIANLYISILGRNPEPAGFGFWCDRLADNGNTTAAAADIARGFANSPEFIATYGAQTTNGAITLMYNNVLDRAPDAGGLTYWVAQANAFIAAGNSVADSYALTGALIITTAGTNNSSDTALIVSKQNAAIASGLSGPTASYTLTTGVDIFNGAGGNDIFDGSLNSNDRVTFQAFDQLNGGAGTDTLIAQGIGSLTTTTTTLQSIENIELYAMLDNGNLNLGNTTGVQSILIANSAGEASSVTGINSTVQTLAVTGNAVLNEVDTYTFGVTGLAAAASVNLVVDGVGDTNTTLNTDNDIIEIQPTTGSISYQTINITAQGSASFFDIDNAESTSLTTINVAGSAALVLDVIPTTVTTINASTMTGALTVTVNGANAAITGGAGNDNINIAGSYTTSDVINGGTGTNTLWLNEAEATATAIQTNISNIAKIRVTEDLDGDVNLSYFGATGLILTAAENAGEVTYAAGTGTLEFGTVSQEEVTFTANGNVASTTDVLNITAGSATAANTALGNIVVNNFETVNLTIQGGAATAESITLSPTPGSVLNILGAFGGALGAVSATTINASGMTVSSTANGVTATTLQAATFFTGSGGIDEITGSLGADRIVGGAGADDLVTGGGNDILQGGLGADTLTMTDQATTATITVVTSAADSFIRAGGVTTATDTLVMLGDAEEVSYGATINTGVVATTVALTTLVNLGTTAVTANGFLVVGAGNDLEDITANIFTLYQDSNGDGIIGVNDFAMVVDVIDSSVAAVTLVGGTALITTVVNI